MAADPPSTPRIAGSAAGVLAGVAVSLALGVLALSAPDIGSFAAGNQLDPSARVETIGIAGVLCLAVSVGALWAVATRRVAELAQWAQVLSPLLIACALPTVFSRQAWDHAELEFLLFIAAVGLILERLLRWSFGSTLLLDLASAARASVERVPPRLRQVAPWLIVIVGVGYYFVRISQLTILCHHRMATSSSDLAEFDNLFFNALHGHPFRSPAIEGELQNWSALKVHAEFGLYLLLPLYALRPGAEALLVIQSGIVAFTAIPIYLFAAARLGRPAGALMALVYLLMPAVHQPNFYDFHFVSLGMFWVAWTLFLLDRHLRLGERANRRSLTALIAAFACALLSREDIGFGLVVLGAIVFFRRPRLGVALSATAATYFVLMKFVIMPRFGTMWFSALYQDLQAPGAQGFGAVVLTLLSNPVFVFRKLITEARLVYLLQLSVPLVFFWMRRPWLALAALPGLPFTLLVTNRPPMIQISFQYVYHWIPYVVAASAIGIEIVSRGARAADSRDLQGARRRAALCAVAFSVLACSFQFGALLGAKSIVGGFGPKPLVTSSADQARLARLQKLITGIPKDASVVASEREGPHVSARLVMYSLKFGFGKRPDYILITTALGEGERVHLRGPVRAGEYGLIAKEHEFLLLRRGADTKGNDMLVRLLRL